MVPKKHADQLRESLASGEIAAVQSTLVADNTPLNSRVYTVRSGDTLSSIASRLGVSTKDLQQWNKLRGSKLKPGQSLTIGAGSSAQRLANNSDSITYRVRKGDSLSSIAKRHGVNIKDVMRWNSDTANLLHNIYAEYVHFADLNAPLNDDEHAQLERLLKYGPALASHAPQGKLLLVTPRPGTISPCLRKRPILPITAGYNR